jgi:2-keto-3-deoxy-L-rhamnonate aldolase RhmA
MIADNTLKKIFKGGGVALGTMLTHLRAPAVAVMMKNAGWDYVFLDAEHGSFTPPSITDFCIAARGVGLPVIVRVPGIGEAQRLYQMLDHGATGLLCPATETVEQVQFILHATKYFPMGQRGMNLRNVHTSWAKYKGSELTPRLNQDTTIVLQIETKLGVENLDKMLQVPGVDAVFVGPADLSQTLGIPGDTAHPEVQKYVSRVFEVCQKASIPCGIHTYEVETCLKWIQKGGRFMCLGNDVMWLMDSSAKAVADVREGAKK